MEQETGTRKWQETFDSFNTAAIAIREGLHKQAKDKYLTKMYAAAAEFITSCFPAVAGEIVRLAKGDASCIGKGYFTHSDIFVLPLDGGGKPAGKRDLQIALRFFYEEAMQGRADDTVKGFYGYLKPLAGSIEVNKGLGGTSVLQSIRDILVCAADQREQRKRAALAPIMLMDTALLKEYYCYNSHNGHDYLTPNKDPDSIPWEQVEKIALDGKYNFRIYYAAVAVAIEAGAALALDIEKASSSMLFDWLRYFPLLVTTKKMTSSLPAKIKKARNVYEASLRATDCPPVVAVLQDAVFNIVAAAGVGLSPRTLLKKEASEVITILAGVKDCLEASGELTAAEIQDLTEVIAPYAFALYTLAQDYKRAVLSLPSERKPDSGEEPPTARAVLSKEKCRREEAEAKNVELGKQLEEERTLSRQRKEKVQKLEERLRLLEREIRELEAGQENPSLAFPLESTADTSAALPVKEGEMAGGDGIDYRALLEEQSRTYKIVLAGCTKPIINRMGILHPGIRCTFGGETTTLEQTFKMADIVFIHTGSISHKQYYKILSVNKNIYRINRTNNVEALEKEMCGHLLDRYGEEKELSF